MELRLTSHLYWLVFSATAMQILQKTVTDQPLSSQ